MREIEELVKTLKRRLKINGINYADLAVQMQLSEASVKRIFASGERIPLNRLIEICHLLGFTLAELAQEAAISERRLHCLTKVQEKEIVADLRLLLVAVCVINHWKIEEITRLYALTEAECIGYLVKLDRLKLITLLPANRVRLNIARDFEWLQDGPIRQFFKKEGEADFLNHPFNKPNETMNFSHAMLTENASEKVINEIRKLRQKIAELHEEGIHAPLEKRHGTGILIAMRTFVPPVFLAMRR